MTDPTKGDALGDRMKAYEAREAERRFLPTLPVYARIDGRNFSAFTRGMARPYDPAMTEVMILTTEALVEETHARIGYTQSDEISLVWQAERYDSSIFFDHRIAKMTSVLASFATAAFICALRNEGSYAGRIDRLPHFDCRVFQLPNRTEAANAFLWREQDATKNAVSMAARSVYSHKALDHKSGPEMQEMLFAKGINFNDYPAFFKRGTFVRRETVWREFTAAELDKIPEAHRPEAGAKVQRSQIKRLDMPRFGSVLNREAVIFEYAKPMIRAVLTEYDASEQRRTSSSAGEEVPAYPPMCGMR
jgi:tRNA(His) 5'-end guanylyltransferase